MLPCTCPSVSSWSTVSRTIEDMDTDQVRYHGTIHSACGANRRWTCSHDHQTRDEAEACAKAELARDTHQ